MAQFVYTAHAVATSQHPADYLPGSNLFLVSAENGVKSHNVALTSNENDARYVAKLLSDAEGKDGKDTITVLRKALALACQSSITGPDYFLMQARGTRSGEPTPSHSYPKQTVPDCFEPQQRIVMNYDQVKFHVKRLAGKLLTILDAAYVNERQNKAVKDLAKRAVSDQLDNVKVYFQVNEESGDPLDAEQY